MDAGEIGLLDGHNLLPTQGGGLRRRPEIHRDQGISEELKDIAEAFGLEIRNELLDKRAAVEGLAEFLAAEREEELLDKVLARVRKEVRDGMIRTRLAPWAIRLFRWIADRPDYVERLDGYPVPTSEESDQGVSVLLLDRGLEVPRRPLAPLAIWPKRAQGFRSLFPSGRVLADDFADGDPEVWPRLVASGYVNVSPLVETQRVVGAFLPDEPLPDTDRRARLRGMRGRVRMWGHSQDLPRRMASPDPASAVGAARRQRAPRDDCVGGVVGRFARRLA